jgi:hypothetical protein
MSLLYLNIKPNVENARTRILPCFSPKWPHHPVDNADAMPWTRKKLSTTISPRYEQWLGYHDNHKGCLQARRASLNGGVRQAVVSQWRSGVRDDGD